MVNLLLTKSNEIEIEEQNGHIETREEKIKRNLKEILQKYSENSHNKTRFLELCCEALEKINNSTSAKYFLMNCRIKIPLDVEAETEEYFCRDQFVKCKLLINLKIFLTLLEKSEGEPLKDIFNYNEHLYKKFLDKKKKSVQLFESKENITNLNLIFKQLVKTEGHWDEWKGRKCVGDVVKPANSVAAKGDNKFKSLEDEKVKMKVKTLESLESKTKFIFKRSSEKRELDNMKNWISLKENNDLLSNLETKYIWVDKSPVEMNFGVMAQECLQGVGLRQVKEEVEKFEATQEEKKDVDEFVKWRFTNRLVKRSYESLVMDHEKVFSKFLQKNSNCFKNKGINDQVQKFRFKKEGLMVKNKKKKFLEFREKMVQSQKGRSRRQFNQRVRFDFLEFRRKHGGGGRGPQGQRGGRDQEAQVLQGVLQDFQVEDEHHLESLWDSPEDPGVEGLQTQVPVQEGVQKVEERAKVRGQSPEEEQSVYQEEERAFDRKQE